MHNMRDFQSRQSSASAFAGVSVTSNTTLNGSWIDTTDLAHLTIIYMGTITDGTYTPTLQESDDQSTITSVASDHTIGSLTALSAGNLINSVGVQPTKRYVRLRITSASTSTGAHVIIAAAVKGSS